jgi:hypothetical protein
MSIIQNHDFFDIRKSKAYTLNEASKFMRIDGQSTINTIFDCQDSNGNPIKREIVVNGKVSDSYEIHSPKEIAEAFERVASKTQLEIQKVITNPHNGGLMISAKYDSVQFAGDDHDVNIVFFTSHCGKYKTFLTLQALRLQCMNQAPILSKGKDKHIFAEKHYKNSLDIALFENLLSGVPQSVTMYNARVENLLDGKMSYSDFAEWYIEHNKINREAKQFDTNMSKVKEAYFHNDNSKIADGTMYRAFHAITWLNTHGGRNTKFAEEQRLTTKASNSQKAMDSLLKLAA